MTHPVVHWEIGANDAAKLNDFYSKLFGWTIDTGMPGYGPRGRSVRPAPAGHTPARQTAPAARCQTHSASPAGRRRCQR